MAITLDGTTGITTPGLTNTGTETIVSLTTTGNTTLGDATTDTLTVGVTGIVKDSSGNVGIGTATPANRLDVLATGADVSVRAVTTSANYATFRLKNSTQDYSMQIRTDQSNAWTLRDETAGANRLLLGTGGNVGIGTTTLTNKLNVAGAIQSTSTLAAIEASSIAISQEAGYSRIASFGTDTATPGILDLRVISTNGGVQKGVRVDASGYLIVGVDITTNQKGNVSVWGATSAQTNYYLQKYAQVEGHIGFVSGTSSNLYINTGATIGTTGVYMANGGTAWTANSDERLKENLVPITDAISKVSTLRSVIGNFIADENKTPRPFLIAQDVQQVLPEAIGTSEIDGVEYLGVSYTEVIPLLVAAIKEQQALIQSLTARITALENPPAFTTT